MSAPAPPPAEPPPEPTWREFARAPLVPVALAAAVGLVVDRYTHPSLLAELVAAAAGLVAWGVARRRTPDRAAVWLWVAAGGLAAAHHHTHRTAFGADDIARFATAQPRPALVRGILDDEPARLRPPRADPLLGRPLPATVSTVLAVTHVETRDGWTPASGRARLTVPGRLDGLHLGDRIEVTALLSLPATPANPGETDYAAMLRDRRITAVLRGAGSTEGVTRLEEGWRGSALGWVAAVRGWGGRTLADAIDPGEAGLAAALLLGDGTALDRDEWEGYVRTGVVHVLAISGQHLVVLAGFAWLVLRVVGVRRRHGAWAVAVLLVGYAILTGARPSAVRAAVTVCVVCGGLVLRRPVVTPNAVALAWLVVVGLNPADPFTPGCQLSFVSVFVLAWTEGNDRCILDITAQRTPKVDVAYSYMRFSTTEQKKGDSIRRQAALRDAFLDRQMLRLDTTLTFVDAGVSGHKGRHRSSDKYALGYFLSLVKTGRIAAGSWLIVESLDRLSREDVDEALELLLSLTRSGIKVVQLLPVEVVFQKPVEPMKLMMGIMELSRGNSESKMKSERIGAAWETKRQKAREGKAISASCPHWLRKKGDGYEIIPERAAAVRLMFELAADGFGISGIITRLIAGGHKPFARASHWSNSYIGRIFSGRAALGEYQPMKDKKPCGEPIPGFYPSLIDDKLYYRVQAGLKQRRLHAGGRSVNDVNIFQGLLYHAPDGDKFEYRGFTDHQKGKVFKYSRYVNSLALVAQAKLTSFPVAAFEAGVLSCLAEIDPMDVLPGHDSTGDEVMSLSHRYEEAAQRLREIEAQLADPANGESIGVLVSAANRVGAAVKDIGAKLAEARAKAANPQSEIWGTCLTLIEALSTAEDREASRRRLQSAVRRVVTKAVCLFVRNGLRQIACVQLHLAGTDAIRTVFVRHRRELVNNKSRTPAYTSWSTLKDELPGKIDIAARHGEVLPVLRKMCEEEYWHKAFEPDRLSTRETIRRRKQAYMKTYRKK